MAREGLESQAVPDAPPETAVVIPTRNRWRLLRTTLATVLAQEGAAVRVVVVDDGSTEPDPGVLRDLDDRVEVLRNPTSLGVSAARNRGLERVEAEWVAFLDDDDVWAPDHLATVHAEIAASEAVAGAGTAGLAYASHIVLDEDRRMIGLRHAQPAGEVADGLLSYNVIGTPSCTVLRAQAVRDVGGFDPALAVIADWDIYLRLVERVAPVASPTFTVGYMLHGQNMHFSAGATVRETAELRRRYGARAAARGRRLPDEDFPRYIAGSYRAAGRRLHAAAWYLRSLAASRTPRDLGRAVGVLLGERAIARSGLRTPPHVDPREGGWLEAVRRLEPAEGASRP